MNSRLWGVLLFLVVAQGAAAGQNSYAVHGLVSIASAISVTEAAPVRFGNITVTDPGDDGASVVLDLNGTRTAQRTAATQITPLGLGGGAAGPGLYRIIGAADGQMLHVSFTDHAGMAISTGNPVILTGPPGANVFHADTFTFNSDGADGDGAYILADGDGAARVRVGATLRSVAGAAPYKPGAYRGTFQIMVSY